MIKIGITGGIGSGKSVVASLLNLYGVPVYVADMESKLLTDTSPVIKENRIIGRRPLHRKRVEQEAARITYIQ